MALWCSAIGVGVAGVARSADISGPALAEIPQPASPAPVLSDQELLALALPPNYRDLILQSERAKHPDWLISISYSDPGRVRVVDSALGLPMREMKAVVIDYTARARDGLAFIRVVTGVALFDRGAFVKLVERDSRSLQWPEGKPQAHADAPRARQSEIDDRFADARRFHDWATQPAEKREIRRRLWLRYAPAIELMKVAPGQAARLRDLLEAREEAPLQARFAALERGVDPFSGAMVQAAEHAQAAAQHDLVVFFGAQALGQLEFLSRAVGRERGIERNEGLELDAADLALSPDELLEAAKIVTAVTDPSYNEAYRKQLQDRDPDTGLSGLDQEILDRYAHALVPGQWAIVRDFYADRPRYERAIKAAAGKNSGWLLEQPEFAAVVRRHVRHEILEQYLAAIRSMAMTLPAGTETTLIAALVGRNLGPSEASYQAEQAGKDRAAERAAEAACAHEWDAAIRRLLGDAHYAELERRAALGRARLAVERGEGAALAVAGCPLTAPQLDAVAEAYWQTLGEDNAQSAALVDAALNPGSQLTSLDLAFLKLTRPVLSEPQQLALQTYRQDLSAAAHRRPDDPTKG